MEYTFVSITSMSESMMRSITVMETLLRSLSIMDLQVIDMSMSRTLTMKLSNSISISIKEIMSESGTRTGKELFLPLIDLVRTVINIQSDI